MMHFTALVVAVALCQAQTPAPASPSVPAGVQGTSVSGVVLEQGTRAPIAGAEVRLVPDRGAAPPPNPFEQRPPVTATDASGAFEFRNVAPGRYRVFAQKAGFATTLTLGGSPPPVVDVADPVKGLELPLVRGGVITGRVVDAQGEPIGEAMVVALRPNPFKDRTPPPSGAPGPLSGAAAPRFVPTGGSVPTNELGEFRIHSLPASEYVIRAQTRNSFHPAASNGAASTTVPTYAPGTADDASAQPIRVAPGETVHIGDIRMVTAAAFQISGVVVDAAGKPAEGVMVRLQPQGPGADPLPFFGPAGQTRTSASGAFTLEPVVNGTYTLLATPPTVIAREAVPSGTFVSGSTSFTPIGRGGVVTETRNGTTVQFRDELGTSVPVTVSGESVANLTITIRAR